MAVICPSDKVSPSLKAYGIAFSPGYPSAVYGPTTTVDARWHAIGMLRRSRLRGSEFISPFRLLKHKAFYGNCLVALQ